MVDALVTTIEHLQGVVTALATTLILPFNQYDLNILLSSQPHLIMESYLLSINIRMS